MDTHNANKYFLTNLNTKARSDWSNKKNLTEYLNELNNFKAHQLGKFNTTFFFFTQQ